jgi:glutamate dehydrogenase (NAD(P)+)
LPVVGSRVVLQGFGKVGAPLAFLLASAGMRIIAISDVGGAVANPGGLDIGEVSEHVAGHKTVAGFPVGDPIDDDAIWDLECELVVPAALGGVIDAEVARRLRTKVIVEAANGPTLPDAQPVLDERGIVAVPDILANAGGVTASYFEWAQSRQGYPWDDGIVAERLRQKMDGAFNQVWARAQTLGICMRGAASVVAVERVAEAIEARGLFP